MTYSDDVINAAEKGTDLTLSGSTSGIESGQTVTVTFGGKTYTASVLDIVNADKLLVTKEAISSIEEVLA